MTGLVTSRPPEAARVKPENPEGVNMTAKTNRHVALASDPARRRTLAEVRTALERNTGLSPTRLRDLRSAVMRVASLLGNVPARIAFDLPTIAAGLAAINPVAAGMTPKRF